MYFTIYQDKAGKWRWTAKAVNHVIIGDSGQGYADKDDCIHGINIIKNEAAKAVIKEA